MITEEQKAYAAGFFDGEACITINAAGSLMLTVNQTAREPIDLLCEMSGGVIGYTGGLLVQNKRPQWRVCLSGEKAANMLRMVVPYMRAKKAHAETALRLHSLSPKERREQRQRLLDLNARGAGASGYLCPVHIPRGRVVVQWTSIDCAYWAGVFDAEGCVSCQPRGAIFFAQIVQVNPAMLVELSSCFDVPVYQNSMRSRTRARPLHSVVLYKNKADAFLGLVRPFLLVKSAQVDLLMEYHDMDIGYREDAWKHLRLLNQKGFSATVTNAVDGLLSLWEGTDESIEECFGETTPSSLSDVPENYVGVRWSAA